MANTDSKLKVKTKEDGSIVFSLPVSGLQVNLREPKTKDLKVLQRLAQDPQVTPFDTTIALVKELAITPDITDALIDEMDIEDALALGDALESFRVLRVLKERSASSI